LQAEDGIRDYHVTAVQTCALPILWQALTAADAQIWLRFDRLPTLDEIARRFAHQLSTPIYYLDLAQSLIRILTGFGLAAIVGIKIGRASCRERVCGGGPGGPVAGE